MQKYGILRLYNAKSEAPPQGKVAGWVDAALVFGFVPLYLAWLPSVAIPLLEKHAPTTALTLKPVAHTLLAAQPFTFPPALVCAVLAVVLWFRAEARSSGLKSVPRLTMGIGTILLGLTLFIDPLKAYIAYGFSHAIEYIVFVWAFQRRRYAAPLSHDPAIGRLLRSPILAYAAFFLLIGGVDLYLEFGRTLALHTGTIRIAGVRASSWLFYWTVWHSCAHFYFDGFLWKMRLPSVRAGL
jgi:hypothetical protein